MGIKNRHSLNLEVNDMNQSDQNEESEHNIKSDETIEFTKTRIIKNLLIVSITFLFSFTASEGLAFLQSTMNKDVGVICFAAQYVCGCIASLFLPKYLIQKFGSKLILVVSMFAYVPYLASNFYPVFAFMMPTSMLVGFASSLVFNSLCTYVNDLASLYTKLQLGNECQNLSLDSSRQEKEILKKKLKDSPQLYNSYRKHKDSIFLTKQSLFGDTEAIAVGTSTTEKEIALIEFKCSSPLNKALSKENAEVTNSIEEDFKKPEKTDILNGKIQIILKQSYDLIKSKTDSQPKAADNSDNSVFVISNDIQFPGGERNFEPKINRLTSVPEGSLELYPEDEIKFENIDDGRKGLPATSVQQSDRAIKVLETTTCRFFGFFGFVYQMCHILCNVISYFIFQNNTVARDYNGNTSCVCGSDFCSMESVCLLHNLQAPSTTTRYTLSTVYVVMSFLSALLTLIFLDKINKKTGEVTFSLEMAVMTFKFHGNKNQLLLLPLSLYIGMVQAFVTGDFTKDFIACAWGVEHVSLVILSTGCGISLFSGLYALLEKHIGRIVIFCTAAALNLAVNIIMLYWTPDSTAPTMMFVVAGMWGAIIGIMWCQIRSFVGLIFKEEEETAFGCYQLWHAFGCAIVYAYNNYICTYVKIYILLIVSTISVIGYLFAERNYAVSKRQRKTT